MKRLSRAGSAAMLAAIFGLAAALAGIPARADEAAARAADVAAATKVATAWLEALDSGDYNASWNGVASVMKEGREEADWVNDVAEPRARLGKPLMRELQQADFETSVRGAPEGKYVIASYLSQFADTPPTLETTLLRLEGDQWRIAGYNVAPAPEPSPPAKAPAPPPGKSQGGAGGNPGG